MDAKEKELQELVEKIDKDWKGRWDEIHASMDEIKKNKLDGKAVDGLVKEKVGALSEENAKKHEELMAEVKRANTRIDETETEISKRLDNFEGPKAQKTPGELFIDSDEYKSAMKSGIPSRVRVEPVSIGKMLGKAVTSASASAGSLVVAQHLPGVYRDPDQQLRIRDLLNVSSTTSGAIEFVQEKTFTDNAAVVAEGSDKPESDITYELITRNVRTIAHWIRASRQILADAPVLQSDINGRLIYGLALKEETELLYGDVNSSLDGIMLAADSYDRYKSGDTKIDTLRRAITQAQLSNYPVTGFVVYNTDWEDIVLTKDSDNRYIFANPGDQTQPRMWGIPVVPSLSIKEGEFLTGAFGLGGQLFDRENSTIRISDSHDDLFTKNMVAILGEERVVLVVYRPSAFVAGTYTSSS
jgi:HK97 family phage major capsid protein